MDTSTTPVEASASEPAGQALGGLPAVAATLAVGGSCTANSVLAHYPHLGGQAVRHAVAALLLVPLLAVTEAGRGAWPRCVR